MRDIFDESSSEHAHALLKTGFWGSSGAGCLFLALDTRRFLVAHRSPYVEQPGTWGTWGGAIDRGENPLDAVKREIREETGYVGQAAIEPLFVFKKDTFQYYNFLAIVEREFTPRLDWENQGYIWCEFGQWPEPLHFGLKLLLADPVSLDKMREKSERFS